MLEGVQPSSHDRDSHRWALLGSGLHVWVLHAMLRGSTREEEELRGELQQDIVKGALSTVIVRLG